MTRNASTLRVIALFLFLYARASRAEIDFCDGDPRVQATTHACPRRKSKRLAVYMPALQNTVDLAIHDRLWALSHYLLHCTKRFQVTLTFNRLPFNTSLCRVDTPPKSHPDVWASCAAFYLARKAGVREDDILYWPSDKWWAPRGGAPCFEKRVALSVFPSGERAKGAGVFEETFRSLSWFGRDCSSKRESRSWQNIWECAGRIKGSAMVDLPCNMKKAAFEHIRKSSLAASAGERGTGDAVVEGVRVEDGAPRGTEPKVRVLLYGREDRPSRVWRDLSVAYKVLKDNARLEVAWVRQMPTGFAGAVRLFRWADIVLSIHDSALGNSVVMREGAEVLEVVKLCSRNVSAERWKAMPFVGWHGQFVGIAVSYLQCREDEKGVSVQVAELNRVLEGALKRQEGRVRRLDLEDEGGSGRLRQSVLKVTDAFQAVKRTGGGAVGGLVICWAVVVLGMRKIVRRKAPVRGLS